MFNLCLSLPPRGHSSRPRFLLIAFTCFVVGSLATDARDGGADPLFAPSTDFRTSINPSWVAIGDLNEDGKPDLVVAHNYTDTVSVLLGDGTGGFGPHSDYLKAVNSYELALGDLNGDGHVDVVTANYGANSMSVLMGNGDGTLGVHTDYASFGGAHGIALADVNGDGKLDAVTANYCCTNSVSVFLGRGDGTFESQNVFATGAGPNAVAIGDLNGDGKPDLVTANMYSMCSASVLMGNGDGTFGSHTDLPMTCGAASVALGDLNGDGNLDLVVGSGDGASVLLGHGDGTFGAKMSFTTGANSESVAIADLDGDGKLDLALSAGNGVVVLLGNGDGTFKAYQSFASGNGGWCAAVGDVNLDGEPDIVTANNIAASVSVFLNCPFVPEAPHITGVADVPNDQGGHVRVTWQASSLDGDPSWGIYEYQVYRRGSGGWSLAGLVTAEGVPAYSLVVHTTADSMPATALPWTAIRVDARTTEDVIYPSWPDSAYSVDNLAPVAPGPFAGAYASGIASLHWRRNPESDIAWYGLYRGTTADFVPEMGNLVAWVTDTAYVDYAGRPFWYKLGAWDQHGNISAYTTLLPSGVADVPGGVAPELALEPVRPNPTRGGALTVRFTLPDAAAARLELLDVAGRSVASRPVGNLGAGQHTVEIGAGLRLTPGIYLVRLTRGTNVRVTRVALLR